SSHLLDEVERVADHVVMLHEGAVALAAQVSLFVDPSVYRAARASATGGNMDSFPLLVTLGFPLLAIVLITLNIANSGHMAAGFSRRLLRLPVETWSAVLVVLLTRLVAILAISALLSGASFALFGAGPRLEAILLLGVVYLVIQVLDWLRGVAPEVTALLIGLIVVLPLIDLRAFSGVIAFTFTAKDSTHGYLLCFAAAVPIAYAIAYGVVARTRCGYQLSLLRHFAPAKKSRAVRPENKNSFASPLAAQIWYELRSSAWVLPVATIGCWVGGVALRWIMVRFSIQGASVQGPASNVLDPTWLWEILPYLALFGASFVWCLRVGWLDRKSKGRPSVYLLRLPADPLDIVRARILAAGVSLLAVLGVVATIATLGFLLIENSVILRMLSEALTNHEASVREILALIVGPPLLAGLVSWIAMFQPRVFGTIFFLPVAAVLCLLAEWLVGNFVADLIYIAVCVFLTLPPLLSARAIVGTLRKGLLSTWSLVSCFLLWAAITLAIFPYSQVSAETAASQLLVCAFIAALPLMPFMNMLNDYQKRSADESAEAEQARGFTRKRAVGLALLLVPLLVIANIRWTTEPSFKVMWRIQGLPTNLAELDAWYERVPDPVNAANLFLAAATRSEQLTAKWLETKSLPGNKLQSADDGKDTGPLDKVMIAGNAQLDRAKPIPADVWQETKAYWTSVARPVREDLRDAAQSTGSRSRYPVDMTQGYAALIPHLARLRSLARLLSIDALVATVEHHPDDVFAAISDEGALAESLKQEPYFISQHVRIAIHQMALGGLEDALNRMTFDDARLKQLTMKLTGTFAVPEKGSVLDRAFVTETIEGLEVITAFRIDESIKNDPSFPDPYHRRKTLTQSMATPFDDALGWRIMQVIVSLHEYRIGGETLQLATQRGYIEARAPQREFDTLHVLLHAPFANWLPHYYTATADWIMRAKFDAASTAIAIERFRLANHRLPRQLDELVPQFLPSVPRDPFNQGAPLSFRVKGDGTYVVYGFGPNFKDDGGEFRSETNKSADDIAFTVAPPEIRDRPQVAPPVAPETAK
ncbi:MAG: hypothetical protein HZB26_10680, partial [Candidatus Hydrogenedentes bacterium]|nr:hypothetical protein [Candidatus Hydrogenedentota bacterium]